MNKRRSIINMDLVGFSGPYPIPDGDIDTYVDRRHLSGLYASLSFELIVPMTGVEVFYPIPVNIKSNRHIYRKDNLVWRGVTKSSSLWRRETTTLRFRIKYDDFPAFYQFHVTNKGNLVRLDTDGYQPFLRASESNYIYILGYTEPVLELSRHYSMSVTYINSERTPA